MHSRSYTTFLLDTFLWQLLSPSHGSCLTCHMGYYHLSHMATAIFMIYFLLHGNSCLFCMATANQAKWQLLFHLHGNCQLFNLFVHSSTPSFEMAVLAHHTFLTFFKMSTMATAACYAWQLLTGPHGNSYSTYMATIICSSNNVRVSFSG